MAKRSKKNLLDRSDTVKNETQEKANTKIRIGDLIKDVADNAAMDYDAASTYEVGQYAIWNGQLVQANQAVAANETPASNKWTKYIVLTADGITADGPNLPVGARALYEFLRQLQIQAADVPVADTENYGKVKRANEESLFSEANVSDYISPAQAKTLFNWLVQQANAAGGFNVPSLEAVLKKGGNEANTPAFFNKGATFIAGTSEIEESEGTGVFFSDMPLAPKDGEFVLLVLDDATGRSYKMKFPRAKEIQDGEIQTPSNDPGMPYLPEYENLIYQSGASVNISLTGAIKADGTPYPIPGSYSVQGLFDQLKYEVADRTINISGSATVDTERRQTILVKYIVGSGARKGQGATKSFLLTISPKPVVDLPKPVVGDISAASYNQGAAVSIQPTVTSSKGGTWSATGLPAGITINSGSGKISGAGVAGGTSVVTVTFTDVDGQTGSKTFTLTIVGVIASAWLKSAAFTTDINTKTATTYISAVSGIASVQLAIVCLDGVTRTGKTRDGALWSSDSSDPNFWQTAVAENAFGGQFNFIGFFYPLSFSPSITGGLVTGKKYKILIRRNSSDTPIERFFYFNPGTNTDISPLLTTEPSEGGTGGNRPPSPPAFTQTSPIYVNEDFEVLIDGFTDPDGDILGADSYSFSTPPAGVSISFVNSTGQFRVLGKASAPQPISISITANDGHGGISVFPLSLAVSTRANAITAIYRRFATQSGITTGGSIVTTGRVDFGVLASGNAAVQIRVNRSDLPAATEWTTLSKGSDGRFGYSTGQISGAVTVTAEFRIVGQTDVITNVYNVLSPFSSNNTADLLVYPDASAGNPTTQLRVGNPDPLNPIFVPVTQWITGPDGEQWLQITDSSSRNATLVWRWTKNGRKTSGPPFIAPANTKLVIEKTDAAGFDPQNDEQRDKAQLVIEIGNPGSPINTQNT